MNVKTGFASLVLMVLLAFSTHPAVADPADVTLAVQDGVSVPAGSTDISITIKVSSDALLAGASFTVSYSDELIFSGVSSAFFDTFIAQGFDTGDRPPCDLDNDNILDDGECDPDGNGTPDNDEFFEQPLIISAPNAAPDGKKEVMIAAATIDVENPGGDEAVILTLSFDTLLETAPDTYEVDIKRSQILNANAGYAVATVIPMLVGYDNDEASLAAQFPEIGVSNVPDYPGVLDGSLTVTNKDADGDSIPDYWEIANRPDGVEADDLDVLTYFTAGGDYDRDGYSDYQEYLNYINGETEYDPTVKNVPGGTGYVPIGINALPAINFLLLGN